MPCAGFVVQSITGKCPVQDLLYKVVLGITLCKICSIKYYCEVPCGRFVVQSSTARCSRCVKQECPTRVSYKSVPQECHARVSHTIVQEECQARVFCKSGFSCDQAPPVRFLLFCRNLSSAWTFKNAFGFVVSIRFLLYNMMVYWLIVTTPNNLS